MKNSQITKNEFYFAGTIIICMIKEEHDKFFKNCPLTSYAIIFGPRTFFSIIKLAFSGKHEFYSFYNDIIFKDSIFFKKTQSSIKIDVIVVKKYIICLLRFYWKVCKIKMKKKVCVVMAIIIEYAWTCLNKQGSEYALGLKYVKILNMMNFLVWQGSQSVSVKQFTEYVLTEFWIYLGF